MRTRAVMAAAAVGLAAASPAVAQPKADGATTGVTVAAAGDVRIPNSADKSLRAVRVTFAPGGSNASHRHAPSAFIYAYVIKGAIRSQVEGQPARIYREGDYWTEEPGAHHLASQNVSRTRPAELVAVFVVDTADTNLTTPDRPR